MNDLDTETKSHVEASDAATACARLDAACARLEREIARALRLARIIFAICLTGSVLAAIAAILIIFTHAL